MSGDEYDQFIEKFVDQVKRHFPNALLQWEDFSKSNALYNLHRYVDKLPSFKEKHVLKMLSYTDRPIIFQLSNPTKSCEALPVDLYKWSNGKAIVATGSPLEDVDYNGQLFRIGQGNNVFIFIGVGLAAILTKIETVAVSMFTTAS